MTHPAQTGLDSAVADVRARIERMRASGGSSVSLFPRWFPEWPEIRKGDVSTLVDGSADPGGAAVVLSSHRNGYVREQAIAEIVRLDDPLALHALILRSSDWVAEVRAVAGPAFLTVWRNRSVAEQAAAVGLLEHLVSARSRFTSEALTALDEFFAEVDPETTQLIDHLDLNVRRVVARRIATRMSTRQLRAALARQDDTVTARVLAKSLASRVDLSDEDLRRLAAARIGSIRADALVWATRRNLADLDSMLTAGLLDSNAIVRSYAQHVLRGRGVDVHGWYVAEWAAGNRLALPGLVEVADVSEQATAALLVSDSNTSLQLAGLKMFARISKDEGIHLTRLLDIVESSNNKCARLALGFLGRDDDVVRYLEDLAVSTPSEGRRLQLARHLVALDRFIGLALALRFASAGNPLGTTLFDRVDAMWPLRHTGPNVAVKQRLIERLPNALSRLDVRRQERLVEMLKPYGLLAPEDR